MQNKEDIKGRVDGMLSLIGGSCSTVLKSDDSVRYQRSFPLIILEGIDCSGKNTIESELNKQTDFRVHCVDRLFFTSLVYNNFFDRNLDQEENYLRDLDLFIENFDPLFVYLQCSYETLKKRLLKRGDELIRVTDLKALIYYYDYLFTRMCTVYTGNIAVINNNMLIHDTVNIIIKKIEKKYRIYFK